MCKKFRAFFVALVTMCCIAVCGVCSVVSFATDTSTDDDFIGPINTTTTTTVPVDYGEDGDLSWIGKQIKKLGTTISDAFATVGDTILDGVKDIFVPEKGYLDAKFEAVKERFAFWESVTDTAQVIKNWFETCNWSIPPVVTVNFTNGKSAHGVDYGTSAKILDFTWYTPYKDAVDVIISAFLWIMFAWRIFLGLPNIISGVAPQAVFDAYQDITHTGDVPLTARMKATMYQNHFNDQSSYRAKSEQALNRHTRH